MALVDGGVIGVQTARIALINEAGQVLTGDKGLPNAQNGIYTVTTKNDGGITTANLTGLAPSITRVWGNDLIADLSVGRAQPSMSFATNFMDYNVLNRLIGATGNGDDGYSLEGHKVLSAIDIISTSKNGRDYHFAFYQGYFTRGDINLQTSTENLSRGTDQLTYTPIDTEDGKLGYTLIAPHKDYGKLDREIFGLNAPQPATAPTPALTNDTDKGGTN